MVVLFLSDHPKPPHSVYPDDKLGPPPQSNFYQQQGSRNIHLSNTTTVTSQPHQMVCSFNLVHPKINTQEFWFL